MNPHMGPGGLVALVAGLALTVAGTLDRTGFVDTLLPGGAVYAGYALIVAGAALAAADRRRNMRELVDAEEKKACREALGEAPDDDYIVDLCAEEPGLFEFLAGDREPAEGPPYVVDMTQEAAA